MICSEQASKYEMKIFERENLFIEGGTFVYRTVVFFIHEIKAYTWQMWQFWCVNKAEFIIKHQESIFS